ncbi:MAG: hypothetical protein IJ275_07320 [Ruminococcus sp.]|nr:hypothetical protein [Ruminococcus sp.]
MAKRRCISVDVYENNDFLDLSDSAKVLYTAFILHTDDDGFIINHRTVMRLLGSSQNVLQELFDIGFVMDVGGVLVIKHWYIHNRIQPTRKVDTIYQEQLNRLYVNDCKEYELLPVVCQQNVDLI